MIYYVFFTNKNMEISQMFVAFCNDYESTFCIDDNLEFVKVNDFITNYSGLFKYNCFHVDTYLLKKDDINNKKRITSFYGVAHHVYIKSCKSLNRTPKISGNFLLVDYNII